MILGNIDWLSISINVLLVVFVVVCLLMSLIILMQRPKQEGLGAAFGGGVTDQVFGARTTNILQKATIYLGSLFFIISLTLAILKGKQNQTKTLVANETKTVIKETIEAEEAPVTTAPVTTSLSEELPEETTPATPEIESPIEAPTPVTPVIPEVPTPENP